MSTNNQQRAVSRCRSLYPRYPISDVLVPFLLTAHRTMERLSCSRFFSACFLFSMYLHNYFCSAPRMVYAMGGNINIVGILTKDI